jgi:hypothetical protein
MQDAVGARLMEAGPSRICIPTLIGIWLVRTLACMSATLSWVKPMISATMKTMRAPAMTVLQQLAAESLRILKKPVILVNYGKV